VHYVICRYMSLSASHILDIDTIEKMKYINLNMRKTNKTPIPHYSNLQFNIYTTIIFNNSPLNYEFVYVIPKFHDTLRNKIIYCINQSHLITGSVVISFPEFYTFFYLCHTFLPSKYQFPGLNS